MGKDQNGHIVVETLTSFLLLVLFMTAILSLINIVVVQSRVHNALTQAAMAMSMYDYTLHAAGIDDEIVAIENRADGFRKDINKFRKNMNDIIDGLGALTDGDVTYNDISSIYDMKDLYYDAYDQSFKWIANTVENPKKMVGDLLNLGASAASRQAYEWLLRPMVGRYLANGNRNGDTYLHSMGVIGGLSGLDFEAVLLNAKGEVTITVSYDVDYVFGALPLPITKISLQQTVKTKAWLGGAGKGYPFGG